MLEKLLFKKIELWACLLLVFSIAIVAWGFAAVVKSSASGDVHFGRLGSVAVRVADFPLTAGEVLFGFGQSTTDPFGDIPDGLSINDYRPGLGSLPSDYGIPSYTKNGEQVTGLVITDPLSGKILQSWKVKSEVKAISHVDNTLVVIDERGYQDSTEKLSKVDADGDVIWQLEISSHHSVFVDDVGKIYTPTINKDYSGYPSKLLRAVLPYRDDGFAVISRDGKLLNVGSLTQILLDNGLIHLITGVGALEWDPIHLNSVKPAPRTTRHYQKGDLLFSLRHLSMVMLYRPSSGKVVWYQLGPWTNQHDADFLESGNISIFGNDNVDSYSNRTAVDSPLSHGYNNIYVYDFDSDQTRVVYQELMSEINVNTVTGGSHRIFPNGDLMAHFPNMGLFLLHRKNEDQNLYFGLVKDGRLDKLSGHNLGTE